MCVTTRGQMEDTGILHQKEVFKYTLIQIIPNKKNDCNSVSIAQTRLWVVLSSIVQEYSEVKAMIRERRFQLRQHQCMLFGVFENRVTWKSSTSLLPGRNLLILKYRAAAFCLLSAIKLHVRFSKNRSVDVVFCPPLL